MSNFNIKYIYQMVDRASRPMRNIGRSAQESSRKVRRLADRARNATGGLRRMGGAAGQSANRLRHLGDQADFADRRLHRLARRMRNMQTIRLGMGGTLTGLGAGLLTRRVGSTLIDYEKKMNFVLSKMTDTVVKVGKEEKFILKGITDGSITERVVASIEALKMLREETKRISRVSIFDPTQVAGGLLQLAQAGLSPEQAKKVLHPAARLAAAGGISPEAAADFATNTANMFGWGLAKTPEIVDVLATAITNTNFDLPDLKESLKYAGASSFSAGQDLKGITASLMALAQVGEKGSTAGNSLARIFESLYKSSGPAVAALKKLGLTQDSFLNKEGRAIPLVDMMEIFSKKVDTHGHKEVQRAIHALFQARGGRGAKHLINLLDVIAEKRAWLDRAGGRAAMMEKLMMSGVYGAYEKMRSSLYEAVIALGDGGLSADIEYLADKVRGLANSFSQLDPSTKKWIGRALLLATAISAVIIPLGVFMWALGALVPIVTLVGGALALLLSPIGLVIAGLAGIATWLMHKYDISFDDIIAKVKEFSKVLQDPIGALEKLANYTFDSLKASISGLGDYILQQLVGPMNSISQFLANPFKGALNLGKSFADKLSAFGFQGLNLLNGGTSLKTPSVNNVIKSEADKQMALKVQTDTNVKVDGPGTITLKLPNGMVAGKINLTTSSDKGRTQIDSAATP